MTYSMHILNPCNNWDFRRWHFVGQNFYPFQIYHYFQWKSKFHVIHLKWPLLQGLLIIFRLHVLTLNMHEIIATRGKAKNNQWMKYIIMIFTFFSHTSQMYTCTCKHYYRNYNHTLFWSCGTCSIFLSRRWHIWIKKIRNST